jgi:hypothetical protein
MLAFKAIHHILKDKNMNENNAHVVHAALLAALSALAFPVHASDTGQPQAVQVSRLTALRNDLEGALQGQVDFAQTHVVAATRRIFDPLLVPEREALVIFTPSGNVTAVSLVITVDGVEKTVSMEQPKNFPRTAKYDEENVFSGNTIVGEYPSFRPGAFSYLIPWNAFKPGVNIKFFVNNDASKVGVLNANKTVFMTNESEGLVLMNIEGCVFKAEATCNVALDQFDMEKSPELARIAAREMFSELPVKNLLLGMGRSYWPYVIARGPDGKPHRYSGNNYQEWAKYGDLTLPAKVGMGNFWRAASNLGFKAPGKYVAISGQLLDVPSDIPVLPPGVGASCGGNSCNYPSWPAGFWHETGHGLGLPHSTPVRYEDWAYRSYDNTLLPNYHPDPKKYGLCVDYLGYHYFNHIVGGILTPPWAARTASAPLIDAFEALRQSNPLAIKDWKHYIAPFTHQQTLQVQQRFGSFPAGLVYAGLWDDHRPAPVVSVPCAQNQVKADDVRQIDPGISDDINERGNVISLVRADEVPVLKGVPVQTLVMTLADPSHDAEKLSQIYPPIVSNYGNVFAPAPVSDSIDRNGTPAAGPGEWLQSRETGKCLALRNGGLIQERCELSAGEQLWQLMPQLSNPINEPLKPIFTIINLKSGTCLTSNLQFSSCSPLTANNRWRGRKDETNSDIQTMFQSDQNGRFIVPAEGGLLATSANQGATQIFYRQAQDLTPYEYTLRVTYTYGAPESRVLYSAGISVEDVLSVAVNIPSEQKPISATLLRNGQVIDVRDLRGTPTLVAPIVVGTDNGPPQDYLPVQYLRSKGTGLCLGVPEAMLAQLPCNPLDSRIAWKLPVQAPTPAEEYMAPVVSLMTAKGCINDSLGLSPCDTTSHTQRWGTYQALTGDAKKVRLVGPAGAEHVTALENSRILMMHYIADNNYQVFDKLTFDDLSPFRRITSSTTQDCVVSAAQGVTLQTCLDDSTPAGQAQEWHFIPIEASNAQKGPAFMLSERGAHSCLKSGLALGTCDVNNPALIWRVNGDMAARDVSIKLQNSATGESITALAAR